MPITYSVILALLTMWLGHRLRLGSDTAERRRAFRSRLDVLLARLRDTDDGSIIRFHLESLESIRDECAKIRGDVFWFRRHRLDKAASQYYSLQQTAPRETVQQSGSLKIVGSVMDFPGRKKIEELLTKMRDYAR